MATTQPNVNGIPVVQKWTHLKSDLRMSTGYEGRGKEPDSRVFPAGTQVYYTTFPYSGQYAAQAGGEPITEWLHTVEAQHGGRRYYASQRIPVTQN